LTPSGSDSPLHVFGGASGTLPGANRAALRWILSAATMTDLAFMDRMWRFTQQTHALRAPHGLRLWWRLRAADGWTAYICHEPPEFRVAEPKGERDHIEDVLPEYESGPGLSQLLGHLVAVTRAPDWDREFLALHETAGSLVQSDPEKILSDGLARFDQAAVHAREDPVTRLQPAIDLVKRECLLTLRMPCTAFSDALLLLSLQGALGQWFEPCDYARPLGYLDQLADSAVSHDRDTLAEAMTIHGNHCYEQGKRDLANALGVYSTGAMSLRLISAADAFWRAWRVAQLNEKHRCRTSLRYTETVADEGFACVMGGVLAGVSFFFSRVDDYIDRKVRRPLLSSNRPTILRSLSSALSPVHPRPFAKALIAAAMASDPGPAGDAAIDELTTIRHEYDTSGDLYPLEPYWIEHQLLKAHKRRGHTDQAERYAFGIAGALRVEQELYGVADGPSTR
jgi:hypothetical protein